MDQTHSATSARNADFAWDEFDASSYVVDNYRHLREDDAQILELTQSWFASALPDVAPGVGEVGAPRTAVHGLDAGCGPNLYPSLAMLPLCQTITLLDYSAATMSWLAEHLGRCDELWRPYWELISPAGSRGRFSQARAWLAERSRLTHGSLFDLQAAAWDVGTMFFAAEAITDDRTEFQLALACFLGALRPGAPFAAAFMEQSDGYEVFGIRFPSVPIDAREVEACLSPRTSELEVHRIEISPAPLRPGYTGMLLALGRI